MFDLHLREMTDNGYCQQFARIWEELTLFLILLRVLLSLFCNKPQLIGIGKHSPMVHFFPRYEYLLASFSLMRILLLFFHFYYQTRCSFSLPNNSFPFHDNLTVMFFIFVFRLDIYDMLPTKRSYWLTCTYLIDSGLKGKV